MGEGATIVRLKLGDGALELRVPDDRLAGPWSLQSVRPGATAGRSGVEGAVRELAEAGLVAAVRGRRVGLLLADGTRAWDPAELLPPLGELLAPARRVDAFLCTGTHDPGTPENRRMAERVGEALSGFACPVAVTVHDARRDEHVELGTTARGTRVRVLAEAHRCEAFLVVADMKHHYFAGYSNPSKYYVPGLAELETVRGNHSLALEEGSVFGRHPWHPDASRRANPLASDLVEAFERFVGERPHFALALVSSSRGVVWSGGGRTEEVSGRAMAAVDDLASLSLSPVRFLVVSAGGAPHDESLYTAQRALELSRDAVLPGGEVLFLARCPNGVGPPGARRNFFEPLTRPLADIRAAPREEYVLYSHKPVKFARLLTRLAAIHFLTDLPPAEVRRIHMQPVEDAQSVVDDWVRRAGPGERIGFLDDAAKLAILPRPQVPMP